MASIFKKIPPSVLVGALLVVIVLLILVVKRNTRSNLITGTYTAGWSPRTQKDFDTWDRYPRYSSADSCKDIAENTNNIGFTYRNTLHGDPRGKNTCIGLKGIDGNVNDDLRDSVSHITGCTLPGKTWPNCGLNNNDITVINNIKQNINTYLAQYSKPFSDFLVNSDLAPQEIKRYVEYIKTEKKKCEDEWNSNSNNARSAYDYIMFEAVPSMENAYLNVRVSLNRAASAISINSNGKMLAASYEYDLTKGIQLSTARAVCSVTNYIRYGKRFI